MRWDFLAGLWSEVRLGNKDDEVSAKTFSPTEQVYFSLLKLPNTCYHSLHGAHWMKHLFEIMTRPTWACHSQTQTCYNKHW